MTCMFSRLFSTPNKSFVHMSIHRIRLLIYRYVFSKSLHSGMNHHCHQEGHSVPVVFEPFPVLSAERYHHW